jgi:hypothetical protein
MFRNLFKTNKKASKAEPAPDLKSKRPCAGEIRTKGFNETLFLAPLPVYSGQVAGSSRNFSEINDTFIEVGGNNWGMVEQGKILAAAIWMALFTAFIMPSLAILAGVLFYSENFPDPVGDLHTFLKATTSVSLLFIIPIGAYLYGMFSDLLLSPPKKTLRFNRQRREVCYVESKTNQVLIVHWEDIVTWIANTQGITTYGATRQYTFGIGLEDKEHDDVKFILISQPIDARALGIWTSIRNYMEDGVLVDTPNPMLAALGLPPTESRLKPYEGLHTFEVERDDARWMCNMKDEGADLSDKEREHYGYPKRTPWPLRRWYMWRVLSFWKMPYMLAEWAHRAGRPALPEKVTTWSNPLPEDHWAKPSPALVKANGVIKEAMNKKGATFIEACKCAGFHP